VFDGQHVVGCLVALDARVRVASESDEAVLAAQHQLRPVDDGHVESLAVGRDAVRHRVEASVHARRHVAAVGGTQRHRAVDQPVHVEQPRRRPVDLISKSDYELFIKIRGGSDNLRNGGVPPLSFPSSFPCSPFLSSPLEVGPLKPPGGIWGSSVSSYHRVRGKDSAENEFGAL